MKAALATMVCSGGRLNADASHDCPSTMSTTAGMANETPPSKAEAAVCSSRRGLRAMDAADARAPVRTKAG
eukprot:scaffold4943_cov127-Isochrysis_galbana.AAC.4